MQKSKLLISVLMAMLLLATQAAYVEASPASQEEGETPISGNVDEVFVEIDPETDEVTAVVITLSFEDQEPQTFRLSLETALEKGLVIEDADNPGNYVVPEGVEGSEIDIEPTTVLPEEEEKEHPVGSAISDFFSDLLGVDYETVMDYHNDGFGFGVITQALWMTNAMEGDSELFSAILEAKRSGDYSTITLPDGSFPENWGQFRKAVMSEREKSKENLGAIKSGRAKESDTIGQSNLKGSNNAPDKSNHSNKDKNKNKDKGKKKE
jgi:hypothetical protein